MARTSWTVTIVVGVLVALGFQSAKAKEQPVKLSGLSAKVLVDINDHGIPHIYARSWPDAARVLGSVRREAPHELLIDSTVHGPVISRQERTISLQWTGLKPSKDAAVSWGIAHAENLPLAMHGDRSKLPPSAKTKSLIFRSE